MEIITQALSLTADMLYMFFVLLGAVGAISCVVTLAMAIVCACSRIDPVEDQRVLMRASSWPGDGRQFRADQRRGRPTCNPCGFSYSRSEAAYANGALGLAVYLCSPRARPNSPGRNSLRRLLVHAWVAD